MDRSLHMVALSVGGPWICVCPNFEYTQIKYEPYISALVFFKCIRILLPFSIYKSIESVIKFITCIYYIVFPTNFNDYYVGCPESYFDI